MSRIDQAFRRAQQGTDAPEVVTEKVEKHESPVHEEDLNYASAWSFTEDSPNGATQTVESREDDSPPSIAALPSEREGASSVSTKSGPVEAAGHSEPTIFERISATSEKLVGPSQASSAAAEQYRQLAAALHHAQKERNIGVVMVSSAVASEGKTLTSTNLALTLSTSYRRTVLLIDADLRRPSVHEVFQMQNSSGLTDGLRAPADQKLKVVEVTDRLSVLTSGRPTSDPMSLLTSERMVRLIEEASERFDWVIMDTPPVGLLSDANLLGAMVDAAVLVVAAGRTPFDMVQRAVDAIGRDRIFGVVLNRVEERAVYGGYSYSGYYHAYLNRE